MKALIKNQKGISLVQTLVAVGIASIVIAGTTSALVSLQQETKGLGETLSSLHLEKTLIAALADGKVCEFSFLNPTTTGLSPVSAQFESGSLPVSKAFSFSRIPLVSMANSPVAAEVNTIASPNSSSLRVNEIYIDILGGTGDSFTGTLKVSFNSPPAVVRSHKDLQFPVVLKTSGAGSTKTVVGCSFASTAATSGGTPTISNFMQRYAGKTLTLNFPIQLYPYYYRIVIDSNGQQAVVSHYTYNGHPMGSTITLTPFSPSSGNFQISISEISFYSSGSNSCGPYSISGKITSDHLDAGITTVTGSVSGNLSPGC